MAAREARLQSGKKQRAVRSTKIARDHKSTPATMPAILIPGAAMKQHTTFGRMRKSALRAAGQAISDDPASNAAHAPARRRQRDATGHTRHLFAELYQ